MAVKKIKILDKDILRDKFKNSRYKDSKLIKRYVDIVLDGGELPKEIKDLNEKEIKFISLLIKLSIKYVNANVEEIDKNKNKKEKTINDNYVNRINKSNVKLDKSKKEKIINDNHVNKMNESNIKSDKKTDKIVGSKKKK